MEDEIINKVAQKNIKTIDLEDFYPNEKRVLFDISEYLYEGLILKEKNFRKQLDENDWSQYENCFVALHCSTDAIIPSWAYLLLTTKLQPFAKKIITGDLELLETLIFNEIIEKLDISEYKNSRVIIKGCSKKVIPQSAYNFLIMKLQPEVKSLMFGEACSTVPLFKQKIK